LKVLLLADIHANAAALEAVLRDAESRSFEEVWCLGDAVGYGPDPNESVQLLRSLEPKMVVGNHDCAVLEKLSMTEFNPDAQSACIWTRHELDPPGAEYLEGLPQVLSEGDFTLVHGSPRAPIWEYMLDSSIALANFSHFDSRFCLVGHTHSAVVFRCSNPNPAGERVEVIIPQAGVPMALGQGRMIINPGSVGQPRDGDPRASYTLLDLQEGIIEYHRVLYPVELTQKKMEARGFPNGLVGRLSLGW
jgi:predicted phosphodiesterase